jgi:hypothetical protein
MFARFLVFRKEEKVLPAGIYLLQGIRLIGLSDFSCRLKVRQLTELSNKYIEQIQYYPGG